MTDQEIIGAMKALLYPINQKLDDIETQLVEITSKFSSLNIKMLSQEMNISQELQKINDAQETIMTTLKCKKTEGDI